MKPIFTFLFLIYSLQNFAQQQGINDIICGSFEDNGKPVMAKQFKTRENIYLIDSVDGSQIVLALRTAKNNAGYKNKGYLTAIDLANGKVLWEKFIHNFDIAFSKNYIVYTNYDGNKVFKKASGEFLYTDDGSYEYLDYNRDFALKTGARHFYLPTRQSNWYRNISSSAGYWEEVKWISDSTFLIAADGIHFLHLRDGKGWSYKIKPKQDLNYAAFGAIIAGSALLGVIGGTVVYYAVSAPSYHGFNSNIWMDNMMQEIIFYSNKKIIKTNIKGEWLWETKIYEEEDGRSILIDFKDKIIRINTGLGVENNTGRLARYATPYLTAYSQTNGIELYHKKIDDKKPVWMLSRMKDTLLINTDNKIQTFNFNNGALLHSRLSDSFKHAAAINAEEVFIEKENKLYSMASLFQDNFSIQKSSDLILLKSDLTIQQVWEANQYYMYKGSYNDLKIYQNSNSIRIENENQLIAILKLSGEIRLNHQKMLVVNGNLLTIVDLSQFSEK